MHEKTEATFHLAHSSTFFPPAQKAPAFSETWCNCANLYTASHFLFFCFFTPHTIFLFTESAIKCWPSRLRLMHVPWRFYFSWPNYRRCSQSPSAAKRNSPVWRGGEQTPNSLIYDERAPSFSSTCHPPNPLPLLILSGCVERPLGGVGGHVDGRLAHRLIGHDPGGELGLSLLEAGVGLPVQAVDLRTKWGRTRWYTMYAGFSIRHTHTFKYQQQGWERHFGVNMIVTRDHFLLNVKEIIPSPPSSAGRPPWQPERWRRWR